MNEEYQKLNNSELKLSAEEKAHMRDALLEAMRMTPVSKSTASPYWMFTLTHSKMAATFAGLLVVILFGGTAYAAQDALPGDPLYSIKIGINEGLAQTLATNTSAKARVHAEIAERRLQEAEALAVRGKLTTESTQKLESNFTAHVAAAQTVTAELDEEDPEEARSIRAQFEASLSAHGAILLALGKEQKDTSTHENSARFAQKAAFATFGQDSASAAEVQPAGMVMLALKTSSSSGELSAEQQTSLKAMKTRAQEKFAAVRDSYNKAEPLLDATTTARFTLQLEAIEGELRKGDAAADLGEYENALKNYREALQGSVVLSAFLKAGLEYGNKSLKTLLQGSDESTPPREDNEGKKGEGEQENGESENSSLLKNILNTALPPSR